MFDDSQTEEEAEVAYNPSDMVLPLIKYLRMLSLILMLMLVAASGVWIKIVRSTVALFSGSCEYVKQSRVQFIDLFFIHLKHPVVYVNDCHHVMYSVYTSYTY